MIPNPNYWKTRQVNRAQLIETDKFEFEFLSRIAEKESWRKEIYRPVYHTHKWWAKRLGSVFRGILLGSVLPGDRDLSEAFYREHFFSKIVVFDPFMGSGTTVGEAHKLGMTALGRDINPVAAESVRVALGPMNYVKLYKEFHKLSESVGERIRELYRSLDSRGRPCNVLYYFWVMQATCPHCTAPVDLFPNWIIARNAYPDRKPLVKLLCRNCGNIFQSINGTEKAECPLCKFEFVPEAGIARGSKAECQSCTQTFEIISAVSKIGKRPKFKLYAKLVLTEHGTKEYLPATEHDLESYERCSKILDDEVREGSIQLPDVELENGYNTRQAMGYNFKTWKDFFNDRQLLGLGWLNEAIATIEDVETRDIFLTLFSGVLEFNNMFASYKGEGTGAVRHMFSHHILKPERTPIEANIWGTPKSSGAFSNLFRSRILKAIKYRQRPFEVTENSNSKTRVCSKPFSGRIEPGWPAKRDFVPGGVYLSCGDSSSSQLPDKSIDLVVTDPPFFDNVHYSELADFFYAWQKLVPRGFVGKSNSTRSPIEVQDTDPNKFTAKLESVFRECRRILKENGLLVFSYHHSRDEGWAAVAAAILNSGFTVVNSHPVKSEMSVASPKSQAKEPIQFDIILVCRKTGLKLRSFDSTDTAVEKARLKIIRLRTTGFSLSKNDLKVILYGQLLTTLKSFEDITKLPYSVQETLQRDTETSAEIPLVITPGL